jgi:hypothetical protein
MPEISDFQRTNSMQSLSDSVHYRQRNIFHKKITKFDPWSLAIAPWYLGVV